MTVSCPRDFPGDGSMCPAMNVQCQYPGIPSSRPGETMTCNCGSDNKFNCRERGWGKICATKEAVGDLSKTVPENQNQNIVLEVIPESLPINTTTNKDVVPETQTQNLIQTPSLEQTTDTVSQTQTQTQTSNWYVIPPADPIATSASAVGSGAVGEDCPKRTPQSGESCVEYVQVERSSQRSCTYNNIQCNCALQGEISLEKGWSCRDVGILSFKYIKSNLKKKLCAVIS